MKKLLRTKVIISIVKKEFSQVLRDVRMKGIIFGTPVLMLIIFGYAVNTDVRDIHMSVFDEDKTSLSRSVIEKFTSSGYFTLYSYCNSTMDMVPVMDSGKIELFIHIHRGMSREIKSGGTSEMQVIIDGSDSSRAAVISAYTEMIVNGFFMDKYMERIKAIVIQKMTVGGQAAVPGFRKGITLVERAFFNPSLSSRNFFLPGVIGLLISLITIMLTSMSIVKERESGTIDQIIVSPIRPMEYIMGKTIPFAIVGFFDMVIVSLLAIFWFNVPFNGDYIFLLLSGLFYIMSTLSVGIYISTISHTQQQAMLTFFLFFMPAFLLSGFVFPIYSMPETIQVITYFNPLMYFIIIIRGVFLKGVGFLVLWKEMLLLLIIGTVLLYLSSRRFSKRLE